MYIIQDCAKYSTGYPAGLYDDFCHLLRGQYDKAWESMTTKTCMYTIQSRVTVARYTDNGPKTIT